jgi:hypothetical protein
MAQWKISLGASTRVNLTVHSGRFQMFVRQSRIRPENSLAIYSFLERRDDCIYRYSRAGEHWCSAQNFGIYRNELLRSLDFFHSTYGF